MRLLLETLAAPAAYAVLVSQLRQIPPKQLDPLIRLRRGHDVLLAVYSGVVAVLMALKLARNDRVRTAHELVCVASPGEPALWLESKVLEWFDTVLLFAAGRSPSTLHLVHHAITPSLVLLSVAQRAHPTPVYDVAVGLNAWCHLWQVCHELPPVDACKDSPQSLPVRSTCTTRGPGCSTRSRCT